MTLTSLRFENIWAILKRAIEENHDVATVDARRYAATTASHKHHERVVIAGKGVEALKLHVSQAARERNARRRLEKNGLRDSTMRMVGVATPLLDVSEESL